MKDRADITLILFEFQKPSPNRFNRSLSLKHLNCAAVSPLSPSPAAVVNYVRFICLGIGLSIRANIYTTQIFNPNILILASAFHLVTSAAARTMQWIVHNYNVHL